MARKVTAATVAEIGPGGAEEATGFRLEQPCPIPGEEAFGGDDYAKGEDIARTAAILIEKYPEDFWFLKEVEIEFLWKKKGGGSGGKVTWGACQRTNPLARFYKTSDFVIWLAADHLRATGVSFEQFAALIFHELLHIAWDVDKMEARIRGHDFEGFRREIEEFGWWRQDLEQMSDTVQSRLSAEEDE